MKEACITEIRKSPLHLHMPTSLMEVNSCMYYPNSACFRVQREAVCITTFARSPLSEDASKFFATSTNPRIYPYLFECELSSSLENLAFMCFVFNVDISPESRGKQPLPILIMSNDFFEGMDLTLMCRPSREFAILTRAVMQRELLVFCNGTACSSDLRPSEEQDPHRRVSGSQSIFYVFPSWIIAFLWK